MAQVIASDTLTKWRTHPQAIETHVWVHQPRVVITGLVMDLGPDVNLDAASYFTDVLMTGVTGNIMNVKSGMTVTFGSAPYGNDLGTTYVNIDQPNSAPVIRIGRSSRGYHQGEIILVYGTYVTVWEEYRVWAKIPNITDDGTMFKDGVIVVGDNTLHPPPIANAGPPVFGIVATPSDSHTFTCYASNSVAIAASSTISTYAWELPASGITLALGSTITDEAPTFIATPGFYYLYLTVTDSNGKSHRCAVLVVVIARTSPVAGATFCDYLVPKTLSLREGGNTMSFDLIDDLAPENFPHGATVVVWESSYVGITPHSQIITAHDIDDDHAGIRFFGWLEEENESLAAEPEQLNRQTTISAVDIIGRLGKIPGFPQLAERETAPINWVQIANLDVTKYLHYLLQWHTTALNIADFIPPAVGTSYPAVSLSSEGGSSLQQLKQIVTSIRHSIRADIYGRIWVKPNPMLRRESDRTSQFFATLADNDISQLNFTQSRWPKQHWLRGSGVSTSSQNASTLASLKSYFCIAPGKAPGQGESGGDQGQLLVATQDELNWAIGCQYAQVNSPWSGYQISLTHPSWIGMDPAYMYWVQLSISPDNQTFRHEVLWSVRFLINDVTISFNPNGMRDISMQLEREVQEMKAWTVIPPNVPNVPSEEIATPIVNYDTTYNIPDIWGAENPTYIPETWIIGAGGSVYRAGYNVATNTMTTTDIKMPDAMFFSVSGDSVGYHLIQDPWNYKRLFFLGFNGIAKTEDWTATTPTWSVCATVADAKAAFGMTNLLFINKISGSINRQGYFGWLGIEGTIEAYWMYDHPNTWRGRLYYFYTTDNFATIQRTRIGTGVQSAVFPFPAQNFILSCFNTTAKGEIWVYPYRDNQDGTFNPIYYSSNWGATFTPTSTYAGFGALFDIPYSVPGGGENGANPFLNAMYNTGGVGLTYYNGFTWVNQDPYELRHGNGSAMTYPDQANTNSWNNVTSPLCFNSYTLDSNTRAFIIRKGGVFNGSLAFFRTTDNGATWTETVFDLPFDTHEGICGWPTNPNLYVAWMRGLSLSTDGGTTWSPIIDAPQNHVYTVIPDLSQVYSEPVTF